jgi:hypothetical protein
MSQRDIGKLFLGIIGAIVEIGIGSGINSELFKIINDMPNSNWIALVASIVGFIAIPIGFYKLIKRF